MTAELFADTIGRVDYAGGMIRLDLISLEPTEGTTQSHMEVRQRVVMPLEGFLTALGTMTNLAAKLAAAGVINVAPPPAAAPEPTSILAAQSKPQSPNFA